MLWLVDVVEVRFVPCTYTVEADTASEAEKKASIGDTYDEIEDGAGEVNDRHVNGSPRRTE